MESYKNKIIAITVSKNYTKELSLALEQNSSFFHKWYIITQEDDSNTINLVKSKKISNVEIVYHPLVPSCIENHHQKNLLPKKDREISLPHWKLKNKTDTEIEEIKKTKKVVFDKGGAIRSVQKFLIPKHNLTENDFILILDSDIVLPSNFLEILSKHEFEYDTIYGANRQDYLFLSDFLENKNETIYTQMQEAGFFQLYKYDPEKLTKCTIDCGWVDFEFKLQFSKSNTISDLWTKHLGIAGINWEGNSGIAYFIDENDENQLNILANELGVGINYKTKIEKLERIRTRLLAKQFRQTDCKTFPSFVIVGFQRCKSLVIKNNLMQHKRIKFGQEFRSDLNYCSNEKFYLSNWNNDLKWYLRNFQRNGLLWGDYSDNFFGRGCSTTIDRMKLTYKTQKQNWEMLPDVSFLIVVRDPVERAFAEYCYYMDSFPVSYNWNWKFPGESFSKNIEHEIRLLRKKQKTDKYWFLDSTIKERIVLNGVYGPIINHFKSELGLENEHLKIVSSNDIDKNSIEFYNGIFNFIGADPQNCLIRQNINDSVDSKKYELCEKTKESLFDFYYESNKYLYELSNINYNAK